MTCFFWLCARPGDLFFGYIPAPLLYLQGFTCGMAVLITPKIHDEEAELAATSNASNEYIDGKFQTCQRHFVS